MKEPSEHAQYVAAILKGMWGRDTRLQKMQGLFAAKLSKKIRGDEMPLPDGRRPTPAEVQEIVAHVRGNARPFSVGAVEALWQMHVDEMWDEHGLRRTVVRSTMAEPTFRGSRVVPISVRDLG